MWFIWIVGVEQVVVAVHSRGERAVLTSFWSPLQKAGVDTSEVHCFKHCLATSTKEARWVRFKSLRTW